MVLRNEIRERINDFCMEQLFKDGENHNHAELGETPAAIVIFLGSECLQLRDALLSSFDSLLAVRPMTADIVIDTAPVEPGHLKKEIQTKLQDFRSRGNFIVGQALRIPVAFVAQMHDPILKTLDGSFLEETKRDIDEIRDMLGQNVFGDIAFYGVFEQDKSGKVYDYTQTFNFLRNGKEKLWRRIYHLQKTFDMLEDAYDDIGKAIAAQLLYDALGGRNDDIDAETMGEGHYMWRYLGLSELRVPEQLVCEALLQAYRKQTGVNSMSASYESGFRQGLATAIDRLIDDQWPYLEPEKFAAARRYLPREVIRSHPLQTGVLSVLFGNRSADESLREGDILGEDLFRDMLYQLAEDDGVKWDALGENVLRSALSESSVLPRFAADTKDQFLRVISELKDSFSTQTRIDAREETYDADESTVWMRVARPVRCLLAKTLLNKMTTDEFSLRMHQIFEELREKSEDIVHELDYLRVNAYGDSGQAQVLQDLEDFTIPVGTSIAEANNQLKEAGRDSLIRAIEDPKRLEQEMDSFVLRTRRNSETLNSMLGSVAGNYDQHGITYRMLVRRSPDIQPAGLQIIADRRYRANTIMILATCRWDAENCLRLYYRTEDEKGE